MRYLLKYFRISTFVLAVLTLPFFYNNLGLLFITFPLLLVTFVVDRIYTPRKGQNTKKLVASTGIIIAGLVFFFIASFFAALGTDASGSTSMSGFLVAIIISITLTAAGLAIVNRQKA